MSQGSHANEALALFKVKTFFWSNKIFWIPLVCVKDLGGERSFGLIFVTRKWFRDGDPEQK
jgi:hypothetical protein